MPQRIPRPSLRATAIGPQGPPSRSGVSVARGTRAHGRFVAATSNRLILRHRYQAVRTWRHRHQGKDGCSAPPGLLGAETGALPSTRAADGTKSLRGER